MKEKKIQIAFRSTPERKKFLKIYSVQKEISMDKILNDLIESLRQEDKNKGIL